MIQLQYSSQALKMSNVPNSNLPAQATNNHNQAVASNRVSESAMNSSYISPHFHQDNQSVNLNCTNHEHFNLQAPYYSSQQCFHFNQPAVNTNIVQSYQHSYQGTNSCAQQPATNFYPEDYGIVNPSIDPHQSSSLNTPTIENRFSPNSDYYSPSIYNSQPSYIQPTTSSATQLQQNSNYLSSEYYLSNYHSAAAAVAANQESNSQSQIQRQYQPYYFNNSHSSTQQFYQDERKEKANSGTQINAFAGNHPQVEGEIAASCGFSSASAANLPCNRITGRIGEFTNEAPPTATSTTARATTSAAEGMRATQSIRAGRFQTRDQTSFDTDSAATCCGSQSAQAVSAVKSVGHSGTSAYGSVATLESLPVCEASQQIQQQSLGSNFVSQTQERSVYQARSFSDEIRRQSKTTGEEIRNLPLFERFSDSTLSKQSQSLLSQPQQLQARATQSTRPKTFHLTNNQQQKPYLTNISDQNASCSRLNQAISSEQRRRVNGGVIGSSCNSNTKQTLSGKSQTSGAQQVISRRKNATRETTAALKEWLDEHSQNPYPTKGEKIMLSIITKMTLIQVSTWFANARRRMKKENKIFWGNKQQAAAAAAIAAANSNVQNRIGKTVSGSSNSVFSYLFQKHHKHIQAPNSMLALSSAASTSASGSSSGKLLSRARDCQEPLKELEQHSRCRKASPKSALYELSVGQAEIGSSAKVGNVESELAASDKQIDETRKERSCGSSSASPDCSPSSTSSSTVGSSTLAMAILSPSGPTEQSVASRVGESSCNAKEEEEKKDLEDDINNNITDKTEP